GVAGRRAIVAERTGGQAGAAAPAGAGLGTAARGPTDVGRAAPPARRLGRRDRGASGPHGGVGRRFAAPRVEATARGAGGGEVTGADSASFSAFSALSAVKRRKIHRRERGERRGEKMPCLTL